MHLNASTEYSLSSLEAIRRSLQGAHFASICDAFGTVLLRAISIKSRALGAVENLGSPAKLLRFARLAVQIFE